MLKQEMMSLMSCYGLPESVTYKAFTGQELGSENLSRLKSWCKLAGLKDFTKPSDFDNWYSISVSSEYGKTVWGPAIYSSPEDGKAVVVLGAHIVPLSKLSGGTLLETFNGFCYFWPDEDEPYFLPINLQSNAIVTQDKLKKALKGDCSQVLRAPMIRYPKLSSLPIGTYEVVGVLTYSGFEGRPTKAIQVVMDNGDLVWYQANTKVEDALRWDPDITHESPVKLEVISHTKTKQGHPMAVVNISLGVMPNGNFFSLNASSNLMLETAEDSVGPDPVEDSVESDPEFKLAD